MKTRIISGVIIGVVFGYFGYYFVDGMVGIAISGVIIVLVMPMNRVLRLNQ